MIRVGHSTLWLPPDSLDEAGLNRLIFKIKGSRRYSTQAYADIALCQAYKPAGAASGCLRYASVELRDIHYWQHLKEVLSLFNSFVLRVHTFNILIFDSERPEAAWQERLLILGTKNLRLK